RPIGAIRNMARNGQSSDPALDNYNQFGLKLDTGFIEELGDPAELENNPILAQVRVKSWIGPDAIDDPETDVAGVGWINPMLWMPYQRGTFVTPNFAGYVSGHSTYSAAAASVLEALTGTPFFPGGMAEYVAPANEFLVFENGPSVDVHLQWATYRDASDQTSLSRIWGGIHPPADDIPGRIAGIALGEEAFAHAKGIFEGSLNSTAPAVETVSVKVTPNPVSAGQEILVEIPFSGNQRELVLYDAVGREVHRVKTSSAARISTINLPAGLYLIRSVDGGVAGKIVVK
ncbi:MAG: T9SS type A sorting domain-containing protein, partial [Bacteroidota bacterium]